MSNVSRTYYDAELLDNMDDTKSVVSNNGGRSVVDGHRSRLLNRDYTSDECLEILSNLGLGYTADQAAKKATSLTENVKSVDLLDPRKMTTGTGNEPLTYNTSSSSTTSDRRNNNMESAAAAVSENNYSNGKRGPIKIPANCTYASGPYEGEVLRNKNLYGKSGFLYQCNYYGHKADDCCQAVVRNPVTDGSIHC